LKYLNAVAMKQFMDDDFMLNSETARHLYHEYADMKKIPVIDYHCHIEAKDIYEDRRFNNITQLWLGEDHYKWRQMRTCGVEEKYITGDASDYEKFQKWSEVLPLLIGNPLYHWSHYELKYYFGYEGTLTPDSCDEVWKLVNEQLAKPEFSARNLIKKSNVEVICTTDDPIDSLEYHKKLKDEGYEVKVLPAWRPDRAAYIEKADFADYIAKLSEVSEINICDFASLKRALCKRMDYFDSVGCKLADNGMAYVMYLPATDEEVDKILKKALAGEAVTAEEELKYKTAFMLFSSDEYYRHGWVMQLHYGVKRDNNSYMFERIGANTGFDCVADYTPSAQLADFLNAANRENKIPKTIVYSLNPVDNTAIQTVIGCFQGGGIKCRVQQGAAWWFNDHFIGMSEHMKSVAANSSLANFVGMLTDSRSFVSYTRHDYFRRIMCDLIGSWVENGEYPNDEKYLKKIVEGIAYYNTKEYFGF